MVLLEPENQTIGTVNEDFAVESMAGDIFQLGNASYRIQRVERGTVPRGGRQRAAAKHPLMARRKRPAEQTALSAAVSRLRAEIAARLRSNSSGTAARRWLAEEVGVVAAAADQLVDYLAASAYALAA